MRKKLFAVIMSVMMMVTFMPAMAFAADEKPVQVWSSDFSTLTMNDVVYSAAKAFNADGSITATANGKTATYYDFTGASIVSYSYNSSTEQLVNMNYDEYLDMIDQTSTVEAPKFKTHTVGGSTVKYTVSDLLGGKTSGYSAYVKFKKPEDVDAAVAGTKVGYAQLSTLDIDPEVELQKYEPYEDVKSLTFPVAFTPKSLPKTEFYTGDTKTCGGVINTDKAVKDHKVYLKMPTDPTHVTYTMEGLDPAETYTLGSTTTLSAPYCGENQNLTITAKNITAKFRDVLSTEYTDAAPEMINVKENGYKFYIQLYRGTDKLGTETLYTVNVTRAPLAIQFQKAYFNFLPGEKVSAKNLFELKTIKAKSVVDVFEADKAEAAKLFETLAAVGFDANSFPTQGDDIPVTLPKGVTTATGTARENNLKTDVIDVDAICNELSNLMKTDADALNFLNNYQFANNEYTPFNGKFRTAAEVNYGVVYNDVTAPNQTKTFHVKKAKALKGTKHFQLKATADYGTLSFTKMSGNGKIKVASNGKVTVKKGLKKGKYVVKVKVKAPGAKATKKVTVKVVK